LWVKLSPVEGAPAVDLPPRVIDKLFQDAGVSTYHPDGDQLEKLHAFARAVVAETLARIPSQAASVPQDGGDERAAFEAWLSGPARTVYVGDKVFAYKG
jgi:hypothetical protein